MRTRNILLKIFIVGLMASWVNDAAAQMMAVKTNALLWGNLTPNLSLELVTTKKTSLEITGFYSLKNTPFDTQLKGAQMEMRYWASGRPMNNLFVGISFTALGFNTTLGRGFRHSGDAIAPGIVFGYDLVLGKHWNVEFATGVGYFWYKERRYGQNTDPWMKPYNEHGGRMLPTKLNASIAYIF
ncbi:DUF3575 domain-containing protein [Bacteroides caecigallinarum]|uniref:DUF3575 domain-containing protein n=1 Tax=Bacteroides caecigallinarum TaxID=1411144 RepID=UPI001F331B3B|nr:DUF3575 domain-containing protein [Bacteroides caecigallinarum]MCF2738419.1 DUF3575 domain-containing protein [Bacteroides caecigallinarum]